MLKGCQREMIMLQTGESTLFESAWFVLRREAVSAKGEDMLAEAHRLIGAEERRYPKRGKRAWIFPFLWGCFLGVAGACLLTLFCS